MPTFYINWTARGDGSWDNLMWFWGSMPVLYNVTWGGDGDKKCHFCVI